MNSARTGSIAAFVAARVAAFVVAFVAVPALLVFGLARAAGAEEPVACRTVADCWLSPSGDPVKRPKRHRGKPLPRGDCGKNLRWLRNLLTCEESVCTVKRIGDKC